MSFGQTYIRATTAYNTFENHVPAYCFRREVTVETEIPAILKVAVCGIYELYLNGRRLTRGLLSPYLSNPEDLVYYDEYQITLQAGANAVGLILGNGFVNNPGGHIWDFDKASYRSAPMFALSVNQNGEEEKIFSELMSIAEEKGCEVHLYSTVTDTPAAFGETEINVRRGELSRSTHPTFAVTVECGEGEGLAYLSSSFWESNPSYTGDIKTGDYQVILGHHGPVVKESVKIDFIDTSHSDVLRYPFKTE